MRINMENCGSLEYTLIEAEPIIGFNLWGERRICLPQLLRFVLPNLDINVIERAVTDLQINCFQCNSDQMHLLHSENIVPTEVVRCGLIRKSDAERLCKYLLQRNQNCDQFYDNMSFISQNSIEVVHTCFGEQRGTLYPRLYTSADSKCIKCFTCNNLFKTFEFVGHTHKLDEVTNTFHWGFESNNWRLLLQFFSDNKNLNINHLNEAKTVLDGIKSMFYEEELNKINKSNMNIVWRPSRKLKLRNTPKLPIFSSKPSHLNYGPIEVYTKTINRGLNYLNADDINHKNYVPNVYLTPKDSTLISESNIDDDDIEEFDNIVEKSVKNQDEVAMNVALQIKREAMPTDQITLGTICSFINKNLNGNTNLQPNVQSTSKSSKSNYSPLVVAQPHTSIPPQFLMLEALWSQLFRDIIQLTHHVQFNTNDERHHLVSQLIRCQDLFRSQWTNLAEENQDLKRTLALELKQRQDIEVSRDQLAVSLKEVTVEKENLSEIIQQLQKRCEVFKDDIDTTTEINDFNKYIDKDKLDNFTNKPNEEYKSFRMKAKRQINYDISKSSSDTEDNIISKHIRMNSNNDV